MIVVEKRWELRLMRTSILADGLVNTACSAFSTSDLNPFIALTSLVVSVLFLIIELSDNVIEKDVSKIISSHSQRVLSRLDISIS